MMLNALDRWLTECPPEGATRTELTVTLTYDPTHDVAPFVLIFEAFEVEATEHHYMDISISGDRRTLVWGSSVGVVDFPSDRVEALRLIERLYNVCASVVLIEFNEYDHIDYRWELA